jgi:hypothetical protein
MRFPLLAIAVLVILTAPAHATGFALLLRSLTKSRTAPPTQTWPLIQLRFLCYLLFNPLVPVRCAGCVRSSSCT